MISKNTQIISGPVLWCNIIYLPKLQTMIQKQRITKWMKNKLSQFNEMLDFFFSDFGFSKFQFILFMSQWDPNIFLAKPSNTAEIEQKVFKCYNPRILFGMQTVSMQNFGIPQNVIYKQLFLSSKINMNMWSHSFVMYYLCFNIQPSIPLIIPYLDPSESFHFIWFVTMKNASFCTLFGWNAINRVHL